MKTERHPIKEQTIEEFADQNDLVMEIYERGANRFDGVERFYASFKHAEVFEDCFLVGSFGDGNTEEEAITDYAARISEETLVMDACTDHRKEIYVPRLIGKEK